ncbi:MAG TPA: glycosyltransferase family 39 protein [Ignavibacteria bacterium]|nr:glycosyltransferase family 39 protein [Ignavibacteria bacterium]
MGLSLSNRQFFLFGLVVLFAGAVIGSVSLTYPFGRDQAIYAYAGKLLLEGRMNYLHVFDLKPPGIHFLFAFIQFVSGESMFNARIFDIAWQVLTAFIVFLISFRLTKQKYLSLLSAVIYLFLYYRQDYWHTLQADGSLNLFFSAAVLLLLSSFDEHSFVKIFFAGILFAAALIFKYTIIVFIPLLFIILLTDRKTLLSLRVKNVLVFCAGLLVVGAGMILLYYLTGALNAFWDIQFTQTPLYTKIAYETETKGYITSQLIKLFTYSVYSPLIVLSLFAFVFVILKKKAEFPVLLLFVWIFSSLFSLIIQWKFYYYHFLVIIPALSTGAVYGLSQVKVILKRKSLLYKLAVSAFTAGLCVFAVKPYLTSYPVLFSYLSGSENLESVYIKNGFTNDSVFMMEKTLKATEIVKNETGIDDGIYVWGFDPLIYYLSGRKCVSRFIYNFPLLWKGENSSFKREFLNEIEKRNPELIIVAENDPLYFISGYDEDSKKLIKRFPEFDSFLSSKYDFFANAGDYEVYKLKKW